VLDLEALPESFKEVRGDWGWTSSRPEVRARVTSANGTVHWLDPGLLVEVAAEEGANVYSDARTLRAPLPALARGAVVEVEVVQTTTPWAKSGTNHRFELQNRWPTRTLRVHVMAPLARPFQVIQKGPSRPFTLREEGNTRILEFEADDIPALKDDEPGSPEDFPGVPLLWVSTAPDWHHAAAEYASIVDRVLAGGNLKALARQVTGGTRDAREAANRILTWMAPLRYASVNLGDTSIVPRAPAEVLHRQFGDCKDLATLVVGLLRAAGFEAWPALLLTESQDNIDEAPGLNLFNHVIVRVGGRTPFWLDATAFDSLPAGTLPTGDQGRRVLVAAAGTQHLERLPFAAPEANRNSIEVRLAFADIGKGRVSERHERDGALAGTFRPVGAKGIADAREGWEKWAKTYWDVPGLSAFSVTPGALTEPSRLELEASDSRCILTGVDGASFRPDLERVFIILPRVVTRTYDARQTPPRKAPLQLRPHLTEVVYRLIPPRGFVARGLAAAEDVALGPGLFQRRDELLPDGSVQVTVRFRVATPRMTPAEVDAFRAALAELRARPVAPVAFDAEVSRAVDRGDFRTAVDRSRALIAEEPSTAMHHVRFAKALLAAGLGRKARDEGQRAVELAPESADVWAELGETLSHDLRGLAFGKGWDRDGAIAAYRKALELREEGSILARLALVLEYGPGGERYGAEARPSDALDLYARYRTLEHSHDMETREATTALRAGQCQRTRERLPWVSDRQERLRLLLSCAALEGGVEHALRMLGEAEGGPSQHAEALESAAQLLTSLRRYPLARALLEAAARMSPGGRDETFPELLRSAARLDERAESGPEQAVRTLLREAVEGGSDARGVPGLGPVRTESLAFVTRMSSFFGSRRVGLELLLGSLRMSVQGSEAVGWEVHSRGPWGAAQAWRWQIPAGAGRPTLVEPIEAGGRPSSYAPGNGELLQARTPIGTPVTDPDATPEDLDLSVLAALAAGDSSEAVVLEATRAVLATARENADALRTLALVRLARGELARAHALEREAVALDPMAPPEGLARVAEVWARQALGFPVEAEDLGNSPVPAGPLADAMRALLHRTTKVVAVQGAGH
jgi:tetratricopeptide (TPR) repeat protein